MRQGQGGDVATGTVPRFESESDTLKPDPAIASEGARKIDSDNAA